MVDISIFSSVLMNWLVNPLFWSLGLIAVLGGLVFFLYIRKRRKLVYKTIELVDYGSGKFGLNIMKSGWFGQKLYLNGLWWSGKSVLRVESGEIIEDFSTEDFQQIDGKRGVVCFRAPLNQKILVPISRAKVYGKEFVAQIPPASYQDATVHIVNETIKETQTGIDKYLPYIMWAMVVIAVLILLVVVVQYVKGAQKEAAETLILAGTKGAEACRDICRDAVSIVKGGISSAP